MNTREKLYGIIDIGSNSVRLMFSDGERTLKKLTQNTKLADGLAKTNRLNDEAIKRTKNAISAFVEVAEEQKAEVHIFATEAVRSGENGKDFVDIIYKDTGYKIDVVCGEMEAQLGFVGASDNQNVCVVDIGGASTEIVCGDNGVINYAKSLPIGAVRLLDNCGENVALLDEFLDEKIIQYGIVPKMEKLVAIGGTASTIVAVLLKMEQYDTNKVHNYMLNRDDIQKVYEYIKQTPKEKRIEIAGLQPGRKDIIVGAIYELLKIMDYLGYNQLFVSEKDNQEGYLQLNKHNWL